MTRLDTAKPMRAERLAELQDIKNRAEQKAAKEPEKAAKAARWVNPEADSLQTVKSIKDGRGVASEQRDASPPKVVGGANPFAQLSERLKGMADAAGKLESLRLGPAVDMDRIIVPKEKTLQRMTGLSRQAHTALRGRDLSALQGAVERLRPGLMLLLADSRPHAERRLGVGTPVFQRLAETITESTQFEHKQHTMQQFLFQQASKLPAHMDINAFVQAVLRESYLLQNEQLKDFAAKVKHYNDMRRQMREQLDKARQAQLAARQGDDLPEQLWFTDSATGELFDYLLHSPPPWGKSSADDSPGTDADNDTDLQTSGLSAAAYSEYVDKDGNPLLPNLSSLAALFTGNLGLRQSAPSDAVANLAADVRGALAGGLSHMQIWHSTMRVGGPSLQALNNNAAHLSNEELKGLCTMLLGAHLALKSLGAAGTIWCVSVQAQLGSLLSGCTAWQLAALKEALGPEGWQQVSGILGSGAVAVNRKVFDFETALASLPPPWPQTDAGAAYAQVKVRGNTHDVQNLSLLLADLSGPHAAAFLEMMLDDGATGALVELVTFASDPEKLLAGSTVDHWAFLKDSGQSKLVNLFNTMLESPLPASSDEVATPQRLTQGSREHFLAQVLKSVPSAATHIGESSAADSTDTEPLDQEAAGAYFDNLIKKMEESLQTVGEDSQLANVDLQNALQAQQQTLQMISNISKVLHDTAMAIIRKIGG